MALSYRSGLLTGLGLSLVAALLLPRWGRPVTKATIKGGMAAYESANESLARLRETLADITAEAAFERAAEHMKASDAERTTAAPQGTERQEPGEAEPVAAK